MKVKMGGIYGCSKMIKGWALGLDKNGDSYQVSEINNPILDEMDCYYQFNILNPRLQYRPHHRKGFEYILNSKKPFIVWEEGGFRQYQNYKRIGWWSYRSDDGIFNNNDVNSDRWKKFLSATGLKIKDWKSPGDKIVLMGQVNADSAMITMFEKGYKNFCHWTEEHIKIIRKYTDRPILIRPHPKEYSAFRSVKEHLNSTFKNIEVSKNFFDQDPKLNHGGGGLYKDLKNAYCVVTFNSNSAVEALCEGIPIFALDSGSIAYEIAHQDLSQIENLNYNIDISSWCNKVAYTMWNSEEIKSGETWAHLKPVYF